MNHTQSNKLNPNRVLGEYMRYETPKSMKEAAGLMAKAKGKACILAGGTDLLVQMKSGMVEPDLIVDIKHIPATQEITKSAKGFIIG
ncbi:MAG: carbon-monoxide dehydrogenase medium subunit, partial [Candidatus Azotimanducaceae bacterium]